MKGIAVSTILKFLLGLLVVVALAFLIFRVIYSPPISENDCRIRMANWCTKCVLAGWDDTKVEGRNYTLKSCASKYFNIPITCENCSDFDPSKTGKCRGRCSEFIPA